MVIRSLEQLHDLALAKRSVVRGKTAESGRPQPAAFVLNMQGGLLMHLFRQGWLHVYETRPKPAPFTIPRSAKITTTVPPL